MATTRITPDQDAIISEIDVARATRTRFSSAHHPRSGDEVGLRRQFRNDGLGDGRSPGGKWQFISHEKGVTSPYGKPREFEHHGKVLEVDPPRTLAYTWFANWHENPTIETVVRWDLTPTSTGT